MDLLLTFFAQMKAQTSLKTEILAGISTFLACFYIIIVNPAILAEAGMPFSAVLTATVLVSAFGSLMLGILEEMR